MNFLEFLAKLLLTGFPLNSEPSVPALGTVMCKAKKVESLRLRSALSTVITCISPELYKPALFFLKAQPKVTHSTF